MKSKRVWSKKKSINGVRKQVHIAIVEGVLGKTLPSGAVVHHANENRRDNRNCNLVICQDQNYHMLLHIRLRALRACGDPDKRRCCFCGQYDDPNHLYFGPRGTQRHRDCQNIYQRRWKAARKGDAGTKKDTPETPGTKGAAHGRAAPEISAQQETAHHNWQSGGSYEG